MKQQLGDIVAKSIETTEYSKITSAGDIKTTNGSIIGPYKSSDIQNPAVSIGEDGNISADGHISANSISTSDISVSECYINSQAIVKKITMPAITNGTGEHKVGVALHPTIINNATITNEYGSAGEGGTARECIAIGYHDNSGSQFDTITFGYNIEGTTYDGGNAIVIGDYARVESYRTDQTYDPEAIAIGCGSSASATGADSIAIGHNASAGELAIQLGNNNIGYSFSVGNRSVFSEIDEIKTALESIKTALRSLGADI